jgi:hypothetical protein
VFGLLQKMLPKIYNKLLAMLLKNWQKTLKFVQLLFANSFKNVLIYCTKAIVFFKLAVFYLCLSYFLQRWQYGWNKTFFLWNSFQYSVVAQLSIGMKCPPPPFFIKKDAGIESRIADVQSPPSFCYPVPRFLSVFQFIATLGEGGGWAQNKRKW